jgi:hypothetical protein
MPKAGPGERGSLEVDPSEVRSRGEDRVPSPGHHRDRVPTDVRSISGWGVDLDFARRNVFPRELPSEVRTARGDVRHWQVARTTVDISNEQPGLTPVFGDTLPSSGFSGMLRSYAYEYGEATTRHWMVLMLADRVERVERTITDALHGRPDQPLVERAVGTRLKHAKPAPRAAGAAAGIVAAAIGVIVWKSMRK